MCLKRFAALLHGSLSSFSETELNDAHFPGVSPQQDDRITNEHAEADRQISCLYF